MGISLLSLARIQSSVQNQNLASRPYSVHWSENRNLKDWTTFINLDIVGSWNGFLFGTKTSASGGYIAPTSDFAPIDAIVNDHIFFRMRYDKHPRNKNATSFGKIQWTTTADAVFSDARSITFPLQINTGFKLYEIDMNQSRNWTGFVNKIRFFPCEDGAVNDEFFLNFFEIGTKDIDFQLDNPEAGVAGRFVGGKALSSDITIVKNQNDKLLVNLDGYGFVEISLTPQTASPIIIARDLALQLSKIAIGGYMRANTFIDPDSRKLIIESGTRAATSSVQIQIGDNSAATVLGLSDGDFIIGISFGGSDPAPNFVSISNYRPTTFELLNFLDNSNDSVAFSLDPDIKILEGGRRDYGTVTKSLTTEVVIEGRGTDLQSSKTSLTGTVGSSGLTFIDLNHPFTDDGKIDFVFFNGVPDPAGSSKWKIFRPLLNGDLTLVSEGVIGQQTITPNPNNGLVLTLTPGAFTADVSAQNIRVRRGDLLGVYNVAMHLGTGRTDKPDALYYELSGDVTGTFTPTVPVGAGDGGIPVYAVGSLRRDQTVLDIDFGKRVNLDSITIFGEESNNDLEYNVASAASASFSADVKGNHTICFTIDPVFNFRFCFERPNVAFNIQALNDGVILADNGISAFGSPGTAGVGGATVQGATYFYINKDGEYLGTFEFQNQDPKLFGAERDPLGLTCFFGSSTPRLDKPIDRAVIYFKDPKNMRAWQIETALGQGSSGGNGSINGFELVPEDLIRSIAFDNKRIDRQQLVFTQKNAATQNLLLNNPVALDVISKTGVRNPQKGVDFKDTPLDIGGVNIAEQATYVNTQWTRFEWDFEPIRTTGFRWYSDYHLSTKISEFEVYASAPSLESLADNIQVLFSSDGETFATAEVLEGTTAKATFLLGNSPRYLRLILRPARQFFAKSMVCNFEQDQISFGEEGRIRGATTLESARVGAVSESTIIPVTNNTGRTADLLVDIPIDTAAAREVLYFSHLGSLEDVLRPSIGGPGRLNLDPDRPLLETENAAINAITYGLRNLASSNLIQTLTANLVPNGGFETGDLTDWNLQVTQSGTKVFQIPAVYAPNVAENNPRFEPSIFTSEGTYSFGFSIDSRVPEQRAQHIPISFVLETAPVDVSEFSEAIDLESGEIVTSFTYVAGFQPLTNPVIRFLSSPTEEGINLSPGSVVNSEYGSNLVKEARLVQSNDALIQSTNAIIQVSDLRSLLKRNTRFIKIRFEVSATSAVSIASFTIQKFLLDSFELRLSLPDPAGVRWYKSWRLGQGDFTDSSFIPITEYTGTVGSHHWYQPFSLNASSGTPVVGQSQGFSNAFSQDRTLGIQAFSRMTNADPGILGCKWDTEKTLTGFRIGLGHSPTELSPGSTLASCAYPRFWFVQVLKRRSEIGGATPDLNNTNHLKLVRVFERTGPFQSPNNELSNNNSGSLATAPSASISTWLFDSPEITEGLVISFTLSCDRYEALVYGSASLGGAAFVNFNASTSCPDNGISLPSFTCNYGTSLTFLQPLESVGLKSLPLDNVKEVVQPNSNVFAAVDLLRPHAIDTNSRVFELILQSRNETDWPSTSPVFSISDTSDPNQVVWGNAGPALARWIRFSSLASVKYEDPKSVFTTSSPVLQLFAVESIPQGIIQSARIYPDITVPSIHTVGNNCEWDNLGDVLTDNNLSTFINYSDYPILAIDLGDPFILESVSTNFRPIHDLVAGSLSSIGDKTFWNKNDNSNFTYATTSFRNISDPRLVDFRSFGSTAPNIAIRWVALRGASNLRSSQSISTTNPYREYLFKSGAGRLLGSFWRPLLQDPITDHPTWFSTKQVGLGDISTIQTTLGNSFNFVEGVDFGAKVTNIGAPYNLFDGVFSVIQGDIWGVAVRDNRGFPVPEQDFPHSFYRVFRDPISGQLQDKTISAFKVLGYNEKMYPKTFRLQTIASSNSIRRAVSAEDNAYNTDVLQRDTSWADVEGTTFTNINTFQDGAGFTGILPSPITSSAFRLVIEESEYPDDSELTQVNDAGGFSTFADISGPQTRVVEFILYENTLVDGVVQGIIDINHASTSSISATSQISGQPVSNLIDEDISTFWQSAGLREAVSIDLPSARPIHRIEWDKDPNLGRSSGLLSTNAPSDFTLIALIPGQQPVTVLTVSGFIGNSFVSNFGGLPITAASFIFQIDKAQGENESATSIQLSELRLIEESVQSSPLVVIDRVLEGPNSGESSTRISYSENSDAVATITVGGMDAGSDRLFSERDFFQLDLHINDISLLNSEYGYIRLGNSQKVSFRWDLKDITLHSGWNTLKLQFQSAADRAVKPDQTGPNYSFDSGEASQVDFLTEDVDFTSAVDGNVSFGVIQAPGIRFFQIVFRGTKAVSDKKLELLLHDFRFVRNRFDDVCKFSKGLYLNNSEALQLPIENIDIALGSVDFWFTPDWDLGGTVLSRGRVIPSLFRVVQPDTKFLNFFYRPGTGFVFMIFDGTRVHQFETTVELYSLIRFQPMHIGVSWDVSSQIGSNRTSVQIMVNGKVVFGSKVTWDAVRTGRGNFVVGGEFSQVLVSNPYNATALAFTTVPTLPARHTASSWGVMENLRVYNYGRSDFPERNDFDLERSALVTANQLIEVSLDGTSFERIGSLALPLVVRDVPTGAKTNIFIRTNIPKGLTGQESRDAALLVTWRTPRTGCE